MLRIERRRYTMEVSVQQWSTFAVGAEGTNFVLSVSGFSTVSGSAYSDTLSGHSGYMFTTFDRDNDVCGCNCAVRSRIQSHLPHGLSDTRAFFCRLRITGHGGILRVIGAHVLPCDVRNMRQKCCVPGCRVFVVVLTTLCQ